MPKATSEAFLALLKGKIEGVDPNIGVVHISDQTFSSLAELEEGGQITIGEVGEFDDSERVGENALRIWVMRHFADPRAFTNASAEYRLVTDIQGFFQYDDEDDQGIALRKAAVEILDMLNTRDVELSDLSTGAGYHGFLGDRPRMIESVQPATIGEEAKIKGHAVTLRVVCYEEISY